MAVTKIAKSATAPATTQLIDGTGVVVTPKKLLINISPKARGAINMNFRLGTTSIGEMTLKSGSSVELPLSGNVAGANGEDFDVVHTGAKNYFAPVYFSGEADAT